MIRIIRWLLTASTRYSYRFVRTLIGLPLMLLPVSARLRNQVAGALAVGLWFFGLWFVVAAAEAPLWGQLMVAGTAVLVIVWTVRMEGRRALVRR